MGDREPCVRSSRARSLWQPYAFRVLRGRGPSGQIRRYPIMNMKRRWTTASIVSVAVLTAAPAFGQVLTASCLDNTVSLAVEEARLPNTLPDNSDPSKLQSKSFAQQMIEGAGFQDFGPAFVNDLCGIPKLSVAQNLALHKGEELWHMAIDRAQQRVPTVGDLPYSDDRPLYWARLQVRAALRQWVAKFSDRKS